MDHTFSHSGDLGDIIYSLPAIRAAGGGILYLFNLPGRSAHGMSAERAALIRPLLMQQSYITDVIYDPQAADHSINGFRDHGIDNLADKHLSTLGMNWRERTQKWLEVDPADPAIPVIFARSSRYHNDYFPWTAIREEYSTSAAFVGLPDEYQAFCRDFGHVEYLKCTDLLEVARLIAGCKLFIGNQSCPAAIAEGLKHNMVLEVCPQTGKSCVFRRLGCILGTDERIELPAIESSPSTRYKPPLLAEAFEADAFHSHFNDGVTREP